MPVCAGCGTEAREGARFCGVCGRPMAPSGGPTGKAGRLPPVTPAPMRSAGPSSPAPKSSRAVLLIATSVLVIAAIVLAVVLVSGSGEEDGVDTAATTPTTLPEAATGGEDSGTTELPATTTSSLPPTTEPPGPVEVLIPTSVSPSNVRAPVELICGGTADYEADNLFDGNPDTGWGASAEDGTGQSVTMTFGGPVRLAKVGITPGFTKYGPRSDFDCSPANAFEYNHIIQEVRWTFDDGTSVVQVFEERPRLQFMDVDVTTSSVTMTILRTRYTGWDTDTVISSMELRGVR